MKLISDHYNCFDFELVKEIEFNNKIIKTYCVSKNDNYFN